MMLTTFLSSSPADGQTPGTATKTMMTAKLVDPEKKAAERAATVEVTTSGVQLVDPAIANEKPVPNQGHLHYRVDNGPVIATPSAKLSFHELTPGPHSILVVLVGNDHKPLGAEVHLTVNVPKGMTHTSGEPASAAPKPAPTSSQPTEPAPQKKGY
jgi:hypothetical protein